jgi:hypothetical protein
MEAGRKPDYKLSVDINGKYYKVGAAWVNDSGTVYLRLDPFVVLPHGENIKLMLIPSDYKPKMKPTD